VNRPHNCSQVAWQLLWSTGAPACCHLRKYARVESEIFKSVYRHAVQDKATACISPGEALDVSSAQLTKVASLVTSDSSRRVAGVYVTSDPWSLMTCVITEIPNGTWAGGYISDPNFNVRFPNQVCCIVPSPYLLLDFA
jgi:hypothetical protein